MISVRGLDFTFRSLTIFFLGRNSVNPSIPDLFQIISTLLCQKSFSVCIGRYVGLGQRVEVRLVDYFTNDFGLSGRLVFKKV